MRIGEIACNKQFLLSSQCFLHYLVLIFHFKCTLKCPLQLVSILTSLKFCSLVTFGQYSAPQYCFHTFPKKPWFICVCSTTLLKTIWEKEKLLIMSNFYFSHSVYYSFGELSAVFIKYEIVVCKLSQFGI